MFIKFYQTFFSTLIIFHFYISAIAQYEKTVAVINPTELKKNIKENALKTNDIAAEFTQTKVLDIILEKLESKGTFKFRKENKIRWEYTSPYQYLVIINGPKIYINDAGNKKEFDVKNNKMFREINKIVIGSVQGNLFENQDYKSRFFENEHVYHIVMQPINVKMQEFVNEVNLYIDKKDLTLKRLKMSEKSGDYTLVDFHGHQVNQGIPDKVFSPE
jgi:outer membrane lipoprotein-sorting protein